MEHGIRVIKAFQGKREALTVTEVAEAAGLTAATARRSLLTLCELGYVARDGRRYQLRPRVVELARPFLDSTDLDVIVLPHLTALLTDLADSANFGVLDDGDVLYLAHVSRRQTPAPTGGTGARLPAYCSSLGRVLLATLSEDALQRYLSRVEFVAFTEQTITDPRELSDILADVRDRGYAEAEHQAQYGILSLGVGIRSGTAVIAGINCTSHSSQTSLSEMVNRLLPVMKATAASIESELSLFPGIVRSLEARHRT